MCIVATDKYLIVQVHGNDTAGNVIIFGVHKSSSTHSDIYKKNVLVLGQGPTFEIKGSFALMEVWY